MDLRHNVHEMAAISIRTLLWNEPEAQEEFLIEADNGDCIFKLLKMLMLIRLNGLPVPGKLRRFDFACFSCCSSSSVSNSLLLIT